MDAIQNCFSFFFFFRWNLYLKRKKKKKQEGSLLWIRFFLLFLFPFTQKMNWCLFYWICIHRDWRGSNPQLPPWQGGALTNWTTIPGKRVYSIHILTVSLSFSISDSNHFAVNERGGFLYFCIYYIEIYIDMHFSEIDTDYS